MLTNPGNSTISTDATRSGTPARDGARWWRRFGQGSALVACGLAMSASCGGSSYPDPHVVPPNARLEVYGSFTSMLSIDVSKDGATGAESPTPPPAGFDPADLVIRGTGAELSRGVIRLDLSVRAVEPLKCTWIAPDLAVYEVGASGPGEVHEVVTNPPDKPTGLLMVHYDINSYLSRIRCGHSDGVFKGQIVLVLTATNTAGLQTSTPPVTLQR